MREVKFRAIPIDEFDAIIGQDCGHGDGTFIFGWGVQENPDGTALFMRDDNDGIIVKADTVGQYTGVHDRKGKEVYEGDVVITYLKRKYVITWIDKYARFAFWKPDIDFASGLYDYGQFEVIGNIHENPELLGGAHDEH
jgi:hypothetical protein